MKARTFSDVSIIPKYSNLQTRGDADLTTRLGKYEFSLPIISANMPAVTETDMAEAMSINGALGILHRFNEIKENVDKYKDLNLLVPHCNIGVSIGVGEESKKRFDQLYTLGARIFCVDVAHGHHEKVKQMLHWINRSVLQWDRSERGNVVIIAGNIATGVALDDLAEWGADVVKVGIGPGSACTTRLDTGVGVPQLYAIESVVERNDMLKSPVQIIADGGCKCVGDIAKALAAGADAVMLGSMLAGTDESPGEYINVNGEKMKVYYGSASFKNKQIKKHIEGRDFLVKKKGSVESILNKIEDGLKSSFSYVGASSLKEFQDNTEFLEITEGGKRESKYE